MVRFMKELNSPKVDPSSVRDRDARLTIDEIGCLIRALQTNKAPGPDGFSVEFYWKFQNKLAPIHLSMYNESLENGT